MKETCNTCRFYFEAFNQCSKKIEMTENKKACLKWKQKRTKEEIEKILKKQRPKNVDEIIRKFQEWCKKTQPKKPYPKRFRLN